MLLGMAGVAEGGKITAQATYQGNSLADIIATWNTDEDGCIQLGVNGNVMETALNVLAQVSASSTTYPPASRSWTTTPTSA